MTRFLYGDWTGKKPTRFRDLALYNWFVNNYKISSVLESPDAWLFSSTTANRICKDLNFIDPLENGKTRHVVSYECEAESLNEAWRKFYYVVTDFLNSAVFYTTSFISFLDWNHVIVNTTKNISLISIYQRTLGTSLDFYSEERVDSIQKIMDYAKEDSRLENFLHCYRMAVLVDYPEKYDAYEKYLIIACEALAGESIDSDGKFRYDRKRLEKIIGKDLHKKFFSHVDDLVGKTVRNSHFHIGRNLSDNKPKMAVLLVNKLREFIKEEYKIVDLPILEIKYSPTRGMYRDDGGLVLVKGDYQNVQILMGNCEPNAIFKDIINNPLFEIYSGKKMKNIISNL